MNVPYVPEYTPSLFNEAYSSTIAYRVYNILKDSVDWNVAHQNENYLDMVKVKYRTFQVECSSSEVTCKLPLMFAEEFGFGMHRYNKLVYPYGNEFEVLTEKNNGVLSFTHGWSDIPNYYVDSLGKGGWASITYIRPKLFVLVLKDRYYRDLMVKRIYPPICTNLSRSVFGWNEDSSSIVNVPLPYCHDPNNFTHKFIVVLTKSDVTTRYLTLSFGVIGDNVLSKDATSIKLIDERGLEWNCTIQINPFPYNNVKVGGEWEFMVRASSYEQGNHVIFGSPNPGAITEFFVKKMY